jgi:hypothetical protein
VEESFQSLGVTLQDVRDVKLVGRDVEPSKELVDVVGCVVNEHLGDTVIEESLCWATKGCSVAHFVEGS